MSMVTTQSSSELQQALAQVQAYEAELVERTQALELAQDALQEALDNQQQLEARAEGQAQLLRYTYEGVGHGVVVIDVIWSPPNPQPDFRFLSWNIATERMTGVPNLVALGKTPEELLGPEQGNRVRQNYLRCLAAEQPFTFEECVPFQGQDCWWLTTLSPITGPENRVHRIVLTTFDITDRKMAEMRLQAKEAQYRSIYEAVNDGFVIIDLATEKIAEVNPAACRMHGYTRADFLQCCPADFVHPDSLHSFSQYLETTKAGQAFACETTNLRQDGTQFDVEAKGAPFSFNDRPHALIVLRDISKRKLSEVALAESEAKFRRLVEDANDVVYALDPEGQFTYLSPQFTQVFGYAVADFIHQSFVPLIHTDDLPRVQESIIKLYTLGEKQTGLEFRLLTQAGQWIWVVCNTSPIKNSDGQTVGLQGIARDVHQHKLAKAELQQKAEELEMTLQELQRTQLQMIQSEKMSSLGQLVAGVAHEINNPVSFIYGNMTPTETYVDDLLRLIEQYQQCYPEPKAEIEETIEEIDLEFLTMDLPKILGSIKMGAERIREIVVSLRTFSRLDEAACKAVDIHAGIDSSLVILEHRLKATSSRPAIPVIKDYGDLPLIECYAGQLNQVIMNILSNALDAMEERDGGRTRAEMAQFPSTLTIATRLTDDERLSITISDNGSGIPEAIRDRIFDPFFTTKPVGKGTGMGMSISYQIVTDNHQGSLRCESSPTGTTFIIDIPQRQTVVNL